MPSTLHSNHRHPNQFAPSTRNMIFSSHTMKIHFCYVFAILLGHRLSLPLLGRAARAAMWLEEREAFGKYRTQQKQRQQRTSTNSVFLFQCGICEKTFVSRYYLDKHMEASHPLSSHTAGTGLGSDGLNLSLLNDSSHITPICLADYICEPLGGLSACSETMNQISPYYGRGSLLGKEYVIPTSDSLFSSSFRSLISFWYHDDYSSDDSSHTNRQQQGKLNGDIKHGKKVIKEGDFFKVTAEMRRRSLEANRLMLQSLLRQHQKYKQADQVIHNHHILPQKRLLTILLCLFIILLIYQLL